MVPAVKTIDINEPICMDLLTWLHEDYGNAKRDLQDAEEQECSARSWLNDLIDEEFRFVECPQYGKCTRDSDGICEWVNEFEQPCPCSMDCLLDWEEWAESQNKHARKAKANLAYWTRAVKDARKKVQESIQFRDHGIIPEF